jgi:hypothetical protein
LRNADAPLEIFHVFSRFGRDAEIAHHPREGVATGTCSFGEHGLIAR